MGMRALVSGQPALLCPRPRSRSSRGSASASASSSPWAGAGVGTTKPNAIIIPVLANDFTRQRWTGTATPPLHALPLSKEEEEDNALLFSCLYPGTVSIDLILLALPAVLGQAIYPMAQLMETAYIGKLGALELASAGIGVAIFNILSKIFNIPLLSIATSFVAEDISKNASKHSSSGKLELPSVSSALVLAAAIGTIEALALFLG